MSKKYTHGRRNSECVCWAWVLVCFQTLHLPILSHRLPVEGAAPSSGWPWGRVCAAEQERLGDNGRTGGARSAPDGRSKTLQDGLLPPVVWKDHFQWYDRSLQLPRRKFCQKNHFHLFTEKVFCFEKSVDYVCYGKFVLVIAGSGYSMSTHI